MYKINILEQAIKEISNTFDLDKKLNIENQGFYFELGDKEYLISFTRTKDRENNQILELEIDDNDKNLFSNTFYIEQTFNDIIKCLELEIEKNKKLKSFNLQVDFNEEMGTLWVASDCSSACEYNVFDKDTFLSAMEMYFDNYLA